MSLHVVEIEHRCPDNLNEPDARERIFTEPRAEARGTQTLLWKVTDRRVMSGIWYCPHCGDRLPRTLHEAYNGVWL